MFRKPYKVKTSTTIKGSERRRLRSLVETSYPNLSPDDVNSLVPSKGEMSQTKAMTHSGSTTMIYHSGNNPTFFQIEDRCYPTVYSLWRHPTLLPVLTTGAPVLDKIINGADLMAPGVLVYGESPEMGGLKAGGLCAVRIHGNRAPVAVGISLLSKEELLEEGVKGKAVQIAHCYKDTLWASGDQQQIPLLPYEDPPSDIQSDDSNEDLTTAVQDVKLDDNDSTETTQVERIEEELVLEEEPPQVVEENPADDYTMDEVLYFSFLTAIKVHGKKISLPVLTSTFYSTYVLKSCPGVLNLDIKKTTHKKLSVFLKKMHKDGLVQIKELTKGVESIVGINIENEIVKSYRIDPLFKRHLEEGKEKRVEEAPSDGIQTNYKFPRVTELHVVSAQVKPLFHRYNIKKGESVSSAAVKDILKRYVKENSLQSETNKKEVTLDPVLSDCIPKKDFKDVMTWEELQEAIVCKMPPAYQVEFEGDDSAPVVRKGKLEPIAVTVDTRTGNKKVTLIHNLDTYGIKPEKLAHHVQVAVAASTTILPAQNGKGTAVLIQGNQIKYLQKLFLEIFKVPRKHLQGLDKKK